MSVSGVPASRSRHAVIVTAASALALVLLVVASAFIGQADVAPSSVFRAFWTADDALARTILFDFRLPRIVLAVLVGSQLAVSGALLQGVTRNALASPDIIGVTAGAGLVAVVMILAVPGAPLAAVPFAALFGGAGTGALVYALAWKKGVSPERLALTGIAVTAVAQAGVTAIVTLFVENNDVLLALQWLSGSLYGKQWDPVLLVLPWSVVGLTLAFVLSHKVDVLLLGEEAATGLGMRVQIARITLVGTAVALAASAVAVVGTIAFVGLIVPHAVRILVGSRHRVVVPLSAFRLRDEGVSGRNSDGGVGRSLFHISDHATEDEDLCVMEARATTNDDARSGHSLRTAGVDLGYDFVVVRDLDLDIDMGAITSIVGPNGCGKSTTLRALSRLLKPMRGVVYLDGKLIAQYPTKEVARRLAMLPQGPSTPEGLTVEDLVWHGRYPHQGFLGSKTADDAEAVEWALEQTRLVDFTDRQLDSLSGGERQRAWVAMALAQQTPILLLDEPTTFMDLGHQLEVLELLQTLNTGSGITIVMVLHELNQASRYSDTMIAMSAGEIWARGTPAEVLTETLLREVFGVDAAVSIDPRFNKPVFIALGRADSRGEASE